VIFNAFKNVIMRVWH